MQNIHDQRLLVIDFGSQYTQLIARRVREAQVYCEIHPFDVPDEFIAEFAPRGIILSGGPETVTTLSLNHKAVFVFGPFILFLPYCNCQICSSICYLPPGCS